MREQKLPRIEQKSGPTELISAPMSFRQQNRASRSTDRAKISAAALFAAGIELDSARMGFPWTG
jgi:hypothetical protein